MVTYAIGDVQGSFEELQALLGSFGFDRAKDSLWFVGDLVTAARPRLPRCASCVTWASAL